MDNLITSIHKDTFIDLISLTNVALAGNKFLSIDANLFKNSSKLFTLTLDEDVIIINKKK
jgi:hypothetical protein